MNDADQLAPDAARLAELAAQEVVEEAKARNRVRLIAIGGVASILLAVLGLNVYGLALREQVGQVRDDNAALIGSVDRLTRTIDGQRSTIARLEAAQDAANTVAACRSTIATASDLATLGSLLAILPNPDDGQQTPEARTAELAELRRQVLAAYEDRQDTSVTCNADTVTSPDPGGP